jgi:neutral ceramidase
MNIGMSEVNITPPLGSHIPGYFHVREASEVLDELYAKALVIEENDITLAFVVLDIISLEQQANQAIRERIMEHTGIPHDHIMISCTHTHTGTPRPISGEDPYYELLERKAADSAILAFHRRRPAKIGFGRGEEKDIAFNRRFFMKDGFVKTNPGLKNPDIVKVAGPIDPEVTVMRIDDLEGNPIGVVSNYACHTDTVGGDAFSADFPGYIGTTVKKHLGADVVSLFFQGACGDINHVDVSGNTQRAKGQHHTTMGRILGAEVLKVREKIQTSTETAGLGARTRRLDVSTRIPSKQEVEAARETLDAVKDLKEEQYTNRQIKDTKIARSTLHSYANEPVVRTYEVQAMHIGDMGIVALPAEMFVEFGLEIKQKSPFSVQMINELSNGSGNGYICTKKAYTEGGYETTGQKFAIGTGERVVVTALELLRELKNAKEKGNING